MDVEVPDGQHLGFSRDSEGAMRAHLFDDDTNSLVGHAELFDVDDEPSVSWDRDEPSDQDDDDDGDAFEIDDELIEALAILVLLGIVFVAEAAAPHLKRWWDTKFRPALRSARAKARSAGQRVLRRDRGPEVVLPANPVQAEGESAHSAGAALEVAFADYRVRMDSSEARDRFVAALVAKAFMEEQLRLLQYAEIDDDAPADLAHAVEAVTPEQVAEAVARMLESDPSLVERAALIQLRTRLASSSFPLELPVSTENAEA